LYFTFFYYLLEMRASVLVLTLALCAVVAVSAAPHHHSVKTPTWTASEFTQSVIMGVSFVDANNGFIAGGDNGVGANALKSTDGGKNFVNVEIHPTMMLLTTIAQSADSAIVTGLGLLDGGNQYYSGSVFKNSSEPKVSMQTTQDAQIVAGQPGSFATTGQFSFFGSNATINGIAFSNDNGASFSFVDVGGDPDNAPARYGSFPTTSVGFVASGSWPPSKKPLRGTPITRNIHLHHGEKIASVHFELEHEDVEAGGWIGVLQRSTDGFQTWETVFTNDTFYFNQISCPSAQVCFAAGENDNNGYTYRTTDGGNTWEEVLVAPNTSIMTAFALSESEVYIAGGVLSGFSPSGSVYHSTDGGNTFTLTTVPGYYFTDLSFVSSNQGWGTAMDAMQQCNVLIYA